jgi:transposase
MDELERAGTKHKRAKLAERAAAMLLREAVIKAVTEDGATEADAARRAGVDRMTVRKWLGKQ